MGGILEAIGNVVSSIFGGNDSPAPAAPTPVEAPKAIPTANAAEVEAARKRSLAAQAARGGRTSTILSDDSEKLGG